MVLRVGAHWAKMSVDSKVTFLCEIPLFSKFKDLTIFGNLRFFKSIWEDLIKNIGRFY